MASTAHSAMTAPLSAVDPEMFALIQQEKKRQFTGLELIASENFTSKAVYECLGSCLTNKYSEGYPGHRYYGGNEVIDQVENLCIQRALTAFHLDAKEWGVNVQPYSGSPANFAVYTGLLQPHDRIMGLDLPSGGHLTHGFYTAKRKVSATSVYFESLPYKVDEKTGLIDYSKLEELALLFRPKIIIAGGSAYPRDWDFKRFREIADECGAYLMTDMAHISGLVAAQVVSNPFEYSHIVTTTTHKSLRGPRAGVIFYRKDAPDAKASDKHNFETKISGAVFPSLQGGPHNNTIAAIATQLKEVATPEFKQYAQQVINNSRALAAGLVKRGYKLATDGSDNHLVLWDVRPLGLTGSKVEKVCDECNITVNKNSVHGDKSAITPGGVRLGTPALTTRGFKESEFEVVAEFLHRVIQICIEIQTAKGKMLDQFVQGIHGNQKIATLKSEVETFASKFFIPDAPQS